MSAIEVESLNMTYRAPIRAEGLGAALKSLVHRRYRKVRAVDDVSFELSAGEVVGFIGPNGAGKTTTMKMLSGILHPTSGNLRVLGYTPWQRRTPFLKRIALIRGSQPVGIQVELTVMDSLRYQQLLYEVPKASFEANVAELTELLELEPLLERQLRALSLGERMRAGLALALVYRPAVLFLDEPTLGLDITAAATVRRFIAAYAEQTGATVLLTSHYMADVQSLCPRLILIDHGTVRYDGPLDKLAARLSPYKLPPDLRPGGETGRSRPSWPGRRVQRRYVGGARTASGRTGRHRPTAGRPRRRRSGGGRTATGERDRPGVSGGRAVKRLARLTILGIRRQFLEWSGSWWFLVTLAMQELMAPLMGLFVWSTVFPGDRRVTDYYVALMVVSLMTASYENHTFSGRIYEGTVSEDLLRPQPVVVGPLSFNLATRVWLLLFGVPVVLVAGVALDVSYTWTWLLPALLVAGFAAVLRFLWTWTLALSAFWTERAHATVSLGDTLILLLGGSAAPIAVLPQSWQGVAEALPFYPMLGLPADLLTGRLDATAALQAVGLQIVWIAVLSTLAAAVWRAGLRRLHRRRSLRCEP